MKKDNKRSAVNKLVHLQNLYGNVVLTPKLVELAQQGTLTNEDIFRELGHLGIVKSYDIKDKDKKVFIGNVRNNR